MVKFRPGALGSFLNRFSVAKSRGFRMRFTQFVTASRKNASANALILRHSLRWCRLLFRAMQSGGDSCGHDTSWGVQSLAGHTVVTVIMHRMILETVAAVIRSFRDNTHCLKIALTACALDTLALSAHGCTVASMGHL